MRIKRTDILKLFEQFKTDGIVIPMSFRKPKDGWDGSDFSKWKYLCWREQQKLYYVKNKDRILNYMNTNMKVYRDEYNKKYYQLHKGENRDKKTAYLREYREKNKDGLNKKQRDKHKSDPVYKIKNSVRLRILKSFKNLNLDKKGHTKDILGCTIEDFKNHLISLFQPGMTLENHGTVWHIDHKIPSSAAGWENVSEEEMKSRVVLLNHYTNLQPMFGKENLAKSDTLLDGLILPW